MFDRCPKECDYITTLDDLEGDHDHGQVADELKVHLKKGERLFTFNVNSYAANRVMRDDGREQMSLNPEDPVFEERVPTHYHEYRDVFNKKDFDQLPERHIWDHVIELMPDFKPIDCKIYPLSPKEQPALQEFIEENLRTRRQSILLQLYTKYQQNQQGVCVTCTAVARVVCDTMSLQ
jgi:hypothetical protein